jgi:hypothetical protein
LYYLLFALYLVIGSYFIARIDFIKNSGLSSRSIRLLFLLNIAVAVGWGWVNVQYSHGNSDIISINTLGWEEYQIMIHDPKTFLTNIFDSNYNNYQHFFGSLGSYWNDLENNIILKFLAFFNIFSRGNYYINSLFFIFFSFFGHIALFRIFIQIYREQKLAVLIGCFLLPSTLLFTSGIGKDNVVFTLLSIFSYCIFSSLQSRFTIKRSSLASLSFIGILLIRNYIALALIPCLIAIVLCYKTRIHPVKIFLTTYLLSILFVLLLPLLNPSLNAAKVIADKQMDFLQIPIARTQIPTDTLLPTTKSLLQNLPQAINHGFLRPYIWDSKNGFDLLIAIECCCYWIAFLFFLVLAKKQFSNPSALLLYGIALACTVLLLTGYIVPNSNSIIRYRSIFLPFIITPLLCYLPFLRKLNSRINL